VAVDRYPANVNRGATDGNRVIVTVLGQDRVGIIAGVTVILAEANVNILDISQTILQEFFVMITVVDMAGAMVDLAELQRRLDEKGRELGVKVTAQHEDIFRFMHRL
jgi:ACT domain-containing protein